MDKFTTFSTENNVWRMKGINVEKREFIRMAYSDGELRQHCRKVDNISFEEQLKLQKVLVEPQDGEESDMDSEQEEPVTKRPVPQPVLQPKNEQPQQTKRNRQIFKHLTVLQKEGISLPPIKPDLNAHRPPLTLFIELDDVFLHTFLCDENFGYMANPNSKEPEHEFLIQEN
jgi:hypothetical protein